MKGFITPIFIIALFLGGCSRNRFNPIYDLNSFFRRYSFDYESPVLARDYLTVLVDFNGNQTIELFDLKFKKIVPLPGVNIKNSIPLSASVSANGNKIAFIRKQNQENKLFIFDRKKGSIRSLSVGAESIPTQVSLAASGKVLAVQVLRNDRFDIQIIRIDV